MSAAVPTLAPYVRPAGVVPTRASWATVAKRWRGFAITGSYMHEVYEAQLEICTPANARTFAQVRAHPHGRKIIRDKPDLLALLRDDEYLASLPPGSVGHGYRSFLTTNRFDAGVFDEAAVIRPIAEARNWHEDFYYFMVRYTAIHDLLHVVCGYGADMAGEVSVIGFQSGQMEPSGPYGKFGHLMAAWIPGATPAHKLRVYRQAIERGRRADKLAAAPWEQLLPQPLDEVRAELGVTPWRTAHPDGTWFSTWTPPGMAPPTRWNYDEILAAELRG